MQHDHHCHAHANGYAKAEYPRATEQLPMRYSISTRTTGRSDRTLRRA